MRTVRRVVVALAVSLATAGGGWAAGGGSGTAFALVGQRYYVATNGSDLTTCQANSNLHPFMTIGRAMQCVASDAPPPFAPDIVHIAAGTYHENVTITGNVNLLGAGAGTTVVRGAGPASAISNNGYTVGISGVTITGVYFGASGGIDNSGGGAMTVTNSLVTNSRGRCGGGIFNSATMRLVNTPVMRNFSSISGGGIYNVYPGTLTLNNSPVLGNFAADGTGGGISNGGNCPGVSSGGTVTLTNSRVADNESTDFGGGGIANVNGGVLTLLNSPVGGSHLVHGSSFDSFDPSAGNGGSPGGGIYNDAGTATLLNSPVSYNGILCDVRATSSSIKSDQAECTNLGGGIYNNAAAGSQLTLKNENVMHNVAEGDGGGLYDNGSANDSCTGLAGVTMSNTFISQNQVDDC